MPATSPEIGQIVNVRARQYLVESVTPPIHPQGDTLVSLACLNDDAQGQVLEVFWEREIDAAILGNSTWEQVTRRGFVRVASPWRIDPTTFRLISIRCAGIALHLPIPNCFRLRIGRGLKLRHISWSRCERRC
jgi:hypothetical protein